MLDNAWDIAVFSAIIVLSMLPLFKFLACLDTNTLKCCSALSLILRVCGKSANGADPVVMSAAALRMKKLQVEDFRRMCRLFWFVSAFAMLDLAYKMVTLRRQAQTTLNICTLVGLYAELALVVVYPKVVTERTLSVFYVTVSSAFSLLVEPFSFNERLAMSHITITTVAHLVLNFTVRSPGVMFLPSLVFGVCSSSSVWFYGSDMLRLRAPSVRVWAGALFCGSLASYCFACAHGQALFRSVCQNLQFEEAKELYSAACALLNSCCDVVVELNAAGQVVRQSEVLSSYLLLGPCLSTPHLVDYFVDPVERERFLQRLTEPMTTGLAEAMQVSLRNGSQTHLRVELLWFNYRRADKQVYWVVGLREFSDRAEASPRQNTPTLPSAANLTVEGLCAAVEEPCEREHSSSPSDVTSIPEGASVHSGSSVGEQMAVATVDASTAGIPIRSLSHGFCIQVGWLPANSQMSKYIAKRRRFEEWLQRSMNEAAQGDEVTVDLQVRLKMPARSMVATCRLIEPQEGEEFDIERVALRFYDIKLPRQSSALSPSPARHLGTPRTAGGHLSL